ncbi:MAG: hypothetical protein J6I84_02840 [Bacilli bacterium]|nr:hypothetical protein [Bacilli bacterium]
MDDEKLLTIDILGRLGWMNLEVMYEGKRYPVFGYGAGRLELLSSRFASFTLPVAPLIREVKPYLRELTEADKITLGKFSEPYEKVDWMNKNNIDYRGLIKKGLAVII